MSELLRGDLSTTLGDQDHTQKMTAG